jgi:chromosomal replication initiator protein
VDICVDNTPAVPGALVSTSQAQGTWQDILDEIRKRVSPQKFQTWFEPIQVVTFEPDKVVLEVPNPFFADWFEEHNLPILAESLKHRLGEAPKVRFVVSNAYYNQQQLPIERIEAPVAAPPAPLAPPAGWTHNLYPRFTFDSFVVGKSNEFAHAASRAVAQEPGSVYNPLFIYGGTGLGKTHLMQAIGHLVLDGTHQARIYYASSEHFMNEMIQAITAGRTLEFRRKYRNLDVLLLDDIQFLSGRDATQEEFFHTFNTLHDARKQIVVTSDRPPREIAKIEERLVSRFNMGLVTDIQPPDLETRVAILRTKAARENIVFPEDVLFLIAERIQRNIRELEGCLVRLSALSHLLRAPITLDLALEVLRVYVSPLDGLIDVSQIQQRVAREFDVSVESLRGKRRTSAIALARQVGIYLTKKLTVLTLVEIGKSFGNRDHSTVLYAIEKVQRTRDENPQFDQRVSKLERELRGTAA